MPGEIPKLRMQEPRVYDFTDDRAATFQASQLDVMQKKAYWRGAEDASLPATAITAISLFFTWVTSEKYRDIFLSGATWEAFFVGVTILFTAGFLVLLVRRWMRKPSIQFSTSDGSEFFEGTVFGESTGQRVPKLLAPHPAITDQKSDRRPFRGARKK